MKQDAAFLSDDRYRDKCLFGDILAVWVCLAAGSGALVLFRSIESGHRARVRARARVRVRARARASGKGRARGRARARARARVRVTAKVRVMIWVKSSARSR